MIWTNNDIYKYTRAVETLRVRSMNYISGTDFTRNVDGSICTTIFIYHLSHIKLVNLISENNNLFRKSYTICFQCRFSEHNNVIIFLIVITVSKPNANRRKHFVDKRLTQNT